MVTGCLGLGGSDSGSALVLTLSREEGPLRDSFVVDLSTTRPEYDEEAFEACLDGATYTTRYHRPFLSSPDDPAYARRGGTYYHLGSVVVDEASVVHPVLRLSELEGKGDSDSGNATAVGASGLPESDRTALRVAHMAARARGNAGGVPRGLVQRGGYVYRREEAVAASDLLADDGPERVTFGETTYAVESSREQFHEPVYRATVEPVADDPGRMEAILRAQFVGARFSSDELSRAARDVLAAARTDGYSESHPYSTGYREVLRRLHRRAYVDGNVGKDAGVDGGTRQMILYDGVYFDYRLRFVSPTDS